ncbi:MAG TPA: hypothetical protein VKF41_09100 [Bryobacteraceae bacterium]|nr:hypothetical protein [Bryobacteraceae bacterium]
MRRVPALFLLALVCLPAQDLPPGVLALSRIRGRVRQAVDRLPDCTCVETVDRYWKPAGKEKGTAHMDRVVLQVLFSGGQELFAAPGDTRWDANPMSFLASGMMGNGLFAVDLKVVFVNNQAIITYKGDESHAGRREARYDFYSSSIMSGYTVQHAGASGRVAIRGAFWADPETYDLLRMEFHAEEIPPALRYSAVSTSIDYNRVRIGASDVLLPEAADLRAADVDGERKWNHIEFTHCQGYHTESTLRFDADVAPAAGPAVAAAPPVEESTLPPGLRIAIALSAPLDDSTPVGSLVEGKVAGSVVQKGKILVPDGALVKGRIRRLERYSDAGGYFTVGLEFTRIETPSGSLRFYAELQDADRAEGVEMHLSTAHVEPGTVSGFGDQMEWSRTDGVRITTHEVPGVGIFFVQGSRFFLPAGFKTVWRTQVYPRSAHP